MVGALLAGALLLGWPALLNGYPIVFSDTGAFLAQTLLPAMIWDKPYVYGPFLHLFHWRVTLWFPLAAVLLGLSHLLWLTQRAVLGRATPRGHVLLCGLLAALTSAPWFASLLMPDIFAPALVLCLYLLGFARLSRGQVVWVVLVATLCAAAHLSHLPLALSLVVLVLLLTRRALPALRAALPLGLALALLMGTNWVGHGRLAVSPFGSVFALARLVADGPAARVIEAACPAAGWHMCRWAGRLPTNSDDFLWNGNGSVWTERLDGALPGGPISLAPEAGRIVALTLRREPAAVAAIAAQNAFTQLFRTRVGDVLGPEFLEVTVGLRLREGEFPDWEQTAFAAAVQSQGGLRGLASYFTWPHPWVLLLGAFGALLAWWRAHKAADNPRLTFVLCVLVGISANALATGALSMPHHRYQSRIIWLLPLAAVLCRLPPRPGVAVAGYRA